MSRKPKRPAEKLAPVADEILDQFGPKAGMSMEEITAATVELWSDRTMSSSAP